MTKVGEILLNIFAFLGIISTICVILSFGLVIYISTIVVNNNDIEKPNQMRNTRRATVFVITLTIITGLLWVSTGIAHFKGMQPEDTTVKEFVKGFIATPFEDKIPENEEDLMGKLFIYYRYDCHGCHELMDEIQEALKDYPVYYVCSRSKQGLRLRELYPVAEVPSIVYTKSKQLGEHYSAPLAIHDGDSGVMLNIDGLNRIVEFYEKQY